MSTPIFRPFSAALLIGTMALTSCGDKEQVEKTETAAAPEQAEEAKLTQSGVAAIPCAMNGTTDFKPVCKHSIVGPADATQLVLEGPEGDFRRFNLLKDGRGLEAADGAEPAQIAVRDDGTILVTVGADKFILPATVKSTTPPAEASSEASTHAAPKPAAPTPAAPAPTAQ